MRWLYKQTAVWERDHTVSQINPSAGIEFDDKDSIPDRFAKVWRTIIDNRHNTLTAAQMKTAVEQFATIPLGRQVREEYNHSLMAPITEEGGQIAVAALHRHKAAGEDGMNNDFYIDLELGFQHN